MRMSSFAMTHRNREHKRGAHPQLTLHPDPAPVQLDELPTEGQPQASALHLLCPRPHLPEPREHCLLILRGDANTRVPDRHLYGPVLWHSADLDPSPLRRELDGIRQ